MHSAPEPAVRPAQVAVVTNLEEFDRLVLKAQRPVVVDFGAAWSGPSRTLGAHVGALARHYAAEMAFVRVDAEAAPELLGREAVVQVPTLRCYLDGRVVSALVGATPGLEVDRWVHRNAKRGRPGGLFKRLGARPPR